MNPTHLMTMTATLEYDDPSGKDRYGNVTTTPRTTTSACWGHQVRRDDITVEELTQIESWLFYFPPGTDTDKLAQFTVGDDTFVLMGPPWHAFNPISRQVSQVELTVKRTI